MRWREQGVDAAQRAVPGEERQRAAAEALGGVADQRGHGVVVAGVVVGRDVGREDAERLRQEVVRRAEQELLGVVEPEADRW